MRCLIPTLILALVGCSSQPTGPLGGHDKDGHGHKHGDPAAGKARLAVEAEPAKPEAGKPTKLTLALLGADGKRLADFDVAHEKKVHLIVIRDGLDRFAHLHPAVAGDGAITTEYAFPTGGLYRLYADYQPKGGRPATARAEVTVAGEVPARPDLKPDAPGKVRGDGLDATVTLRDVKAGGEGVVRFEVVDPDGKPALDLEPYMGAMGHLVVVSADGKEYVHAHPVDEKAAANVVAFGAHFPAAGLYKGWGQFKRRGEVAVVPFVLRVE